MSEYDTRLDGLRAVMADAGVDLAVIGPTANMRYLTGHVSHPDERVCVILVSAGSASLVVPKLNADEWAAHTQLPLHTWEDAEGPKGALTAALKDRLPVRRLAADGAMRADFLLSVLGAADPREIVLAERLMARLRICKSLPEIAAMERAAAQADRAMRAALDACRIGATEAQAAWAAEAAFRLDGAEEVCFSMVGAGPNGAHPHHTSGGRALQQGDAVVIDIGASLDGYKSDITRMAFLGGEPPPEFLKAYQAVSQANEGARAAVKPGVTAHAVDQTARRSLEEAGCGQYFIHRTGHGLGLEVHEPPYIMAGNEQVLEEGMVFSIEPGVYLPGQFGIRIEDIVLVTSDGARTLTGFPHELALVVPTE
jgi:Xaa-Pro aminopeptidase